jgi:hypothetical protein
MDICSEGGGVGQNSDTTDVPQDAQEYESRAENSRKRTHLPSYPRQSERTQSRHKLARRKLAAQGFTTLPDFLKQMSEKEKRQARLAALVAAATTSNQASNQPGSKQPGLWIEEEEETSKEGTPEPFQVDSDTEEVQSEDSTRSTAMAAGGFSPGERAHLGACTPHS